MKIMQSRHQIMALMACSALAGICNLDDEAEDFSLADLADLDVSDIAEIRYETLPQMTCDFNITEATIADDVDKEGGKRFLVSVTSKIVAVRAALESGVDKEAQVGKSIIDKMYIRKGVPAEETAKDIGRVRAFVADVGMNSAGKLGEIVANLKDHNFTGKIIHQKDKNDKSVIYARLKLEPAKK